MEMLMIRSCYSKHMLAHVACKYLNREFVFRNGCTLPSAIRWGAVFRTENYDYTLFTVIIHRQDNINCSTIHKHIQRHFQGLCTHVGNEPLQWPKIAQSIIYSCKTAACLCYEHIFINNNYGLAQYLQLQQVVVCCLPYHPSSHWLYMAPIDGWSWGPCNCRRIR